MHNQTCIIQEVARNKTICIMIVVAFQLGAMFFLTLSSYFTGCDFQTYLEVIVSFLQVALNKFVL